jgi:uridine kinase
VTASAIPRIEPPRLAVAMTLAAIERWRDALPGTLVIAVDGPGASGKSTIASQVAEATGAALIHTDDFFHWPGGPASRAMENYYDWHRLRTEALEPLRAGIRASFREFDWAAGRGLTGLVTVEPSELIVIEGVFSSAPQLSDLTDRSVLVETAPAERLRRLRSRVTPDEWDDDWLAAEQTYFGTLRPPASFSLVVPGVDDLSPLIQVKGTT